MEAAGIKPLPSSETFPLAGAFFPLAGAFFCVLFFLEAFFICIRFSPFFLFNLKVTVGSNSTSLFGCDFCQYTELGIIIDVCGVKQNLFSFPFLVSSIITSSENTSSIVLTHSSGVFCERNFDLSKCISANFSATLSNNFILPLPSFGFVSLPGSITKYILPD